LDALVIQELSGHTAKVNGWLVVEDYAVTVNIAVV
jgi:hypothetical protein